MLPTVRALVQGHALFCRANGIPCGDCEQAIVAALALAGALSAARSEDEPAALLFALTLHPRPLGKSWEAFPILVAKNLARSIGMELDVEITDVELEHLRLRAVQRGSDRAVAYEAIRTFLAARLRFQSR